MEQVIKNIEQTLKQNKEQNKGEQNAVQNLEKKPIKISISLPTNAYFISGIRNFTLSLIRNMSEFSEQWAFRFQSIVDELCNNAIEHGSSPGSEIKIIFTSVPHESMEILVQDSGTGKVKISAAELSRLVNERRNPQYIHKSIRGRGLSKIVSEWTDELEFTDLSNGGIQVRIKKNLDNKQLKETSQQLQENTTHLVLS